MLTLNIEGSSPSLLRSFPPVFWVSNVMELFERAAYYGMNSVLAIYLSNSVDRGGLGFSEESVGFLQSLIYALTYVVPILGGALASSSWEQGPGCLSRSSPAASRARQPRQTRDSALASITG